MKTTKWMGMAMLAIATLGVATALACGPADLAPQAAQPAESASAMELPHERSVVECLLEVAPDVGVHVSNADSPDRVRTDANRFSEDDCGSMIIDSGEEYEVQLRWNGPWASGIELEYLTGPVSGAGNPGEGHGE